METQISKVRKIYFAAYHWFEIMESILTRTTAIILRLLNYKSQYFPSESKQNCMVKFIAARFKAANFQNIFKKFLYE